MTKKEARERKTAWNQAIREGRMVRYEVEGGFNFRSYATPGAAQAVVAALQFDGLEANIVPPELAQ